MVSHEEKKKMPPKPKPVNARGVSAKGIPSNSEAHQQNKGEVDDLGKSSMW